MAAPAVISSREEEHTVATTAIAREHARCDGRSSGTKRDAADRQNRRRLTLPIDRGWLTSCFS